jgi:Zn-dependent M28 family amino/carboxypeptidase
MRFSSLALAAALTLGAAPALAQQQPTPSSQIAIGNVPQQAAPAQLSVAEQAAIAQLQQQALRSSLGFSIVESLTTEVGPRLAGSVQEARAREWAVAKLKALGFQNVRIEPFTIPFWERTVESAAIISPAPQKLFVTALGYSAPTPKGGLEAEVAAFPDLVALRAAPDSAVKGKIVFIDEDMTRAQDGSGYGPAVAKRSQCRLIAAPKGAAACLIRSVGTDSHRFPHTGSGGTEGPRLPNAALSAPDADQLARLLARGPVRVRLEIGVETKESAPSGNVIGEIVGSERPEEIVVIGGHLDSWDPGTGAVDDGAGVAITMAAAKLIAELPQRPKRTIRVVLWGAEETGLYGARAYAAQHKDQLARHVIAAESDFGAGRIWRFESNFGPNGRAASLAMARAMAPLGVFHGPFETGGGPDVGPLRAAGVPVAELGQDGTDYFDLHHTPDDTLDKIDPAALAQNVAAYATFTWLAANMGWSFR